MFATLEWALYVYRGSSISNFAKNEFFAFLFTHFCTAPGTVNPSLWQHQWLLSVCHPIQDHLLIFLTRIYCLSESWATLRSSCWCIKISDCLSLNPLLMRIKAKLNQSFSPSQGQPKQKEDQRLLVKYTKILANKPRGSCIYTNCAPFHPPV